MHPSRNRPATRGTPILGAAGGGWKSRQASGTETSTGPLSRTVAAPAKADGNGLATRAEGESPVRPSGMTGFQPLARCRPTGRAPKGACEPEERATAGTGRSSRSRRTAGPTLTASSGARTREAATSLPAFMANPGRTGSRSAVPDRPGPDANLIGPAVCGRTADKWLAPSASVVPAGARGGRRPTANGLERPELVSTRRREAVAGRGPDCIGVSPPEFLTRNGFRPAASRFREAITPSGFAPVVTAENPPLMCGARRSAAPARSVGRGTSSGTARTPATGHAKGKGGRMWAGARTQRAATSAFEVRSLG